MRTATEKQDGSTCNDECHAIRGIEQFSSYFDRQRFYNVCILTPFSDERRNVMFFYYKISMNCHGVSTIQSRPNLKTVLFDSPYPSEDGIGTIHKYYA